MPLFPGEGQPLPFVTWEPDKPQFGGGQLIDAQNVLPKDGYYCSSKALVPSANQNALAAQCIGAFAYRQSDGDTQVVMGTTTALFTTISDGTLVDITRTVGGAYTGTAQTYWNFAQGGDTLYATNFADAIQKFGVSDSDFANLGGSPPKCKHIAVHKGFLFLGNTETSPLNLRWSSINNFTSWTPGVDQADTVIFPDGGAITNLVATDVLWVVQEECLRRVVPVGPEEIMQIDKVINNLGGLPNGAIGWRNMIFVASENGFFLLDGVNAPEMIGQEKVDNWWKSDRKDTMLHRLSPAIDPQEKLVMWNYVSRSTAGEVPDTQIIYNYATKTWSYRREQIERILSYHTFSVALDSLTGVIADNLNEFVDSPAFLGGKPLIGGIDANHKLATFTGVILDGTLQTAFLRLDPLGYRVATHGVKVMSDCDDVQVIMHNKEALKGSTVVSEAAAYSEDDDVHKLRFSGRWISTQVNLRGGDWEKIQGIIDLEWTQLGER